MSLIRKHEFRIINWRRGLKKTFTDSPKYKVEEYIPEIINNIIVGFEQAEEHKIQGEIREKEQERHRRIEEAKERKRAEEERKVSLLHKMATQFNGYNSIKRLIAQIRKKYEAEIISNDKLNEWLDWAEKVAERNNPIKTIDFLQKFTLTYKRKIKQNGKLR